MQGWIIRNCWLHTEMLNLSTVGHPFQH